MADAGVRSVLDDGLADAHLDDPRPERPERTTSPGMQDEAGEDEREAEARELGAEEEPAREHLDHRRFSDSEREPQTVDAASRVPAALDHGPKHRRARLAPGEEERVDRKCHPGGDEQPIRQGFRRRRGGMLAVGPAGRKHACTPPADLRQI